MTKSPATFSKKLRNQWFGKKSSDGKRKRSTKQKRTLTMQALEGRRLMAAGYISGLSSSGTVNIVGSDTQNDKVVVDVASRGRLRVSLQDGTGSAGREWKTFDQSKVKKIQFYGKGGHDSFTNKTSVNSVAYLGNGNDYASGGSGHDTFFAGLGNDRLYGGGGNDRLYGSSGNDSISGGSGNDRLYGGFGNDRLYGNSGHDIIAGGSGNDHLYGHSGNDRLYGESGHDLLKGGYGNDRLYGSYGNDTLSGGAGNDRLSGQSGNDRLYGSIGNDHLHGGSGRDYLYGGSGNDTLSGSTGNDRVYGESGNDRLYGGSGNDHLEGGSGSDRLHGDSGNDLLKGGSGNDVIYGGDHHDKLYGESGVDFLYGQNGDDVLFGGVGSWNFLFGGTGIDRVLAHGTSLVGDGTTEDAVIRFKDRGEIKRQVGGKGELATFSPGAWTNEEIMQVDASFADLQAATGNTKLLKTSNGGELTYYRNGSQQGGSFTSGGWNTGGRSITLVDQTFSQGDAWLAQVVFHEHAHNFDDENQSWDEWKQISGWKSVPADTTSVSANATTSGDGKWTYTGDQNQFARSYGTYNPREDFATYFAKIMMDDTNRTFDGNTYNARSGRWFSSDGNLMAEKTQFMRDWLSRLA